MGHFDLSPDPPILPRGGSKKFFLWVHFCGGQSFHNHTLEISGWVGSGHGTNKLGLGTQGRI
ncbi:hypothetical protein Hanom_Chr13g01209681 [Helianthus anomalus]